MENYTLWSKSMCIALLSKNKIGFVDGTCRKNMYEGQMAYQWERVNAIVLSWIMSSVSKDLVNGIVYSSNAYKVWADLKERFDKVNATKIYHVHREIATLTQGTSSISSYFSRLSELWEEYESLVPPPSCACDKSHEFIFNLEQQKLMQFLGGLNETYSQSRSQILMMPTIPSANQAYSLIIHEESQRAHLNVAAQISHSKMQYEEGESSALAAAAMMRRGQSLKQKSVLTSRLEEGESSNSTGANNNLIRSNNNTRIKRNPNLQCDFCHLKGHTREQCYKLIGYPPDFKFTRNREREQMGFRGGNINNFGYRSGGGYSAHNANLQYHEELKQQTNGQQLNKDQTFTAEQFKKLLSLIDKQNSPESVANMVGKINYFLAGLKTNYWIVDTGASNHMVSSMDLKSSSNALPPTPQNQVYLPNGDIAQVTHKGTCQLHKDQHLKDVWTYTLAR